MPDTDDVSGRIGALSAKIDANTELTHCISRKLDVHAESHKVIDQHMIDVRRVLFDRDGVLDQVRDCKNFRAGQAKAGPEWAGWIAAIGGVLAALAVIAQVLVMIFHK